MVTSGVEDLNLVFAALANEHRREIIHMLALHPRSISQLATMRDLSLPAIHKHIRVLEEAAMVRRRKVGRTNYLAELDTLLEKATLEQVNKAIKKHWQTKNMFVTIVTDDGEAKALADSLINNTPSPMSYSNLVKSGLPADVLAEDEVVANYPLNVKKVTIVDSADTFQ